jgi:hypothetical protein
MCKFSNDPTVLLTCNREGLSEGSKNSCEIYQKETGRDASIFGFTYKETTDSFRDENFVKNNPDLCRSLGIEPCDNKNYAINNTDSCAGKIAKNPCLSANGNYKYLRENVDECRKLKLGEPCSISDYLVAKPYDCRGIKKADGSNYEPCSIDTYLSAKPYECRDIKKADGTNYEPCSVDEFLVSNPYECRDIKKADGSKYEPCSVDGYLISKPAECRGIADGKNYEPCSVESYLVSNPSECRGIKKPDGTNYEPCSIKSYLFNNSKECRNSNYEACEKSEFLFNNSAECRTVKDKDGYTYEACYNNTYSKEQISENSKRDRTDCLKVSNCDKYKAGVSLPAGLYLDYDNECIKRDFKRYNKCEDKTLVNKQKYETKRCDEYISTNGTSTGGTSCDIGNLISLIIIFN